MDSDSLSFRGEWSGVDSMLGMRTESTAGRRDGRSHGEMRAMSVSYGELTRADGSARVRLGTTDVLVAIYGPIEFPHNKQDAEAVHVHVAFGRREAMSNVAGAETGAGTESVITRDLEALVSYLVLATLHPRKAVVVAVQVLADSGGVICAAINSTTIALIDAGLPLRALPLAASVSIHNNAIIVDPVVVEEREADAVVCIVFDTALENDDGFMSVYAMGDCGGEELFAATVQVCRQLVVKTRAFFRLSLERKAAVHHIWNAP
ncbi:Exosome complex component RRP46 [Gracilariopsis chorda]|uniref:Exosome complex component RRP46 n=1 Tax=Gracilariopsis chorda TaxID=448386 RepID=A0A2V3IRU5_9FLOR|nr:Exosome complex component RRP46 [Gracilariopsis chorda]|eukprot:PXF44829.1 Exosome complex component RRP46 [Gracilariopsis chorda]